MNRTVERTFSILRLIADQPQGITLQEISQRLDMPKSSTFVIIHTLLELGQIKTMENNDKKYCLGLETFTLGMKYSSNQSIVQHCSNYLPAIAEKYNKTAFLGVLNGIDVVYLYKYVAKNARLASCAIGSSKPAYATALGKTLLAFQPPNKYMQLIDQIEFTKFTKYTIVSKEALLKELEMVRIRGYSTEHAELADLTVCYSAPIFDQNNNLVAAISLSDIDEANDQEEQIVQDLKTAAREISRAIGFFND